MLMIKVTTLVLILATQILRDAHKVTSELRECVDEHLSLAVRPGRPQTGRLEASARTLRCATTRRGEVSLAVGSAAANRRASTRRSGLGTGRTTGALAAPVLGHTLLQLDELATQTTAGQLRVGRLDTALSAVGTAAASLCLAEALLEVERMLVQKVEANDGVHVLAGQRTSNLAKLLAVQQPLLLEDAALVGTPHGERLALALLLHRIGHEAVVVLEAALALLPIQHHARHRGQRLQVAQRRVLALLHAEHRQHLLELLLAAHRIRGAVAAGARRAARRQVGRGEHRRGDGGRCDARAVGAGRGSATDVGQ
mmetsp:Transcript_44639/g.112489  ORF Transcript_44639/g.112489 Transcript_44639/m.112489 type:complete len:312 (-) Transcript_44639:626-1561(-)